MIGLYYAFHISHNHFIKLRMLITLVFISVRDLFKLQLLLNNLINLHQIVRLIHYNVYNYRHLFKYNQFEYIIN